MIFFRGWGLVILPVALLLGVAVMVFADNAMSATQQNTQNASVIAAFAAAALCWWWGRRLNDPAKDRIAVDTKTGEKIRIESRHTLMFIPIQWYAIPIFLFFITISFLAPQS